LRATSYPPQKACLPGETNQANKAGFTTAIKHHTTPLSRQRNISSQTIIFTGLTQIAPAQLTKARIGG
jgi:hypothetical protein